MNFEAMAAGFQDELEKISSELTPEGRSHVAPKNFAVSSKESNTGKPAYPIPDKAHARSALGFAAMHGDKKDVSEVRKDVEKKFPGMVQKKEGAATTEDATQPTMGQKLLAGALGGPGGYFGLQKGAPHGEALGGAVRGSLGAGWGGMIGGGLGQALGHAVGPADGIGSYGGALGAGVGMLGGGLAGYKMLTRKYNKEPKEKSAAVVAERMQPGTEHLHSDWMREVLASRPPTIFRRVEEEEKTASSPFVRHVQDALGKV
jgi:hypothetical protein